MSEAAEFKTKKTDKTLTFVGAKLFNYLCNIINLSIEVEGRKLQTKFINGFKSKINAYLLEEQGLGENH